MLLDALKTLSGSKSILHPCILSPIKERDNWWGQVKQGNNSTMSKEAVFNL